MRHRTKAVIAIAGAALALVGGAQSAKANHNRGPLVVGGVQIGVIFGVGYGTQNDFDFDTIAEALQASLNEAGAQDVIEINEGFYEEDNLTIFTPVQIRVDGDVTIQGVDLMHGAIFIAGAAGASGAVIGDPVHETGRLTLLPVDDAVEQRGVLIQNGRFVEVHNTDFVGFRTAFDGGGISGLVDVVANCTFDDCDAAGDGGGVFGSVSAGDALGQVLGCTFTNCDAGGDGGAVASVDTVAGGAITACTAGGNGGGIHNVDDLIDEESIFFCTSNGGGGGGIADSDADISRCSIQGNTANSVGGSTARGGGLFNCSGDLISNCLVTSNHADGHGGGMFNCDADIKFCDFVANDADDEGGAARNCDGTIRSSIFVGNFADNGGNNGDMMSNSSNPTFCFVHFNWSGGGSSNQRNANNDAGFVFMNGFAEDFEIWDLHLRPAVPPTNPPTAQIAQTRNTGRPNDGVAIDLDGDVRTVATPDIGAFEFEANEND